MATNINQELFKRYSPKKKLGLINGLGQSELLATAPETIKRIAKETGRSIGKSRNKVLRISNDRRSGNNWNSDIEAVEFINGNLYLNIYFQMDNTDTNICEKYLNFFKGEEYHGKHYTTNKYGDTIPHYFTYNREDKAGVIKSILLEYVHTKYADKL
ncbi:MAG: hypothetical protein IJA95_12070 [Bacteroidaceae bacterium]|nr:hypothetical protein [Bacteroidaceae bacterium]